MRHTLRRWQFTLRQMLVAVAIVALLLGVYFWTMTVDVWEVPPDTPVAEHYFGFVPPDLDYPPLTEKDIRPRNIARVNGRFFPGGSRVSATLYLVDGGKFSEINSLSVGESSNRIGAEFGEPLRITFALGDFDVPNGRVTSLGCVGETSGGGNGRALPHTVKSSAHALLAGRIHRGDARVVYAEGEQAPTITPGMRIEDFASKNPGSYLAVTMRLK